MTIALASDHAGYKYKEAVKCFLHDRGYDVADCGTSSEEAVDYPLVVMPVAKDVAIGRYDRAIVFGRSGNGEAMAANRIPGIRCALCWNTETARLSREHNDANMLSIGQDLVPLETALDIVRVWLSTAFSGGRHEQRIRLLDETV
ncbi:MAG: ribose 5-phosphate isomerase B [Kiritimatiellia bacterium]